MTRPARLLAATGALMLLALVAVGWSEGWNNLWTSPDQRGHRLMAERRYGDAAMAFTDPMWMGVAQFRAGNFKEAAQIFGGLDTAQSAYDQGNALIMLGKYEEAIARYDRALVLHPGWADAEANRTLARLRAERVRQTGGDAGDQREGADQIVYDKDKKDPGGQDTTTDAVMSDEAARALWLKRVQTRPADFLKARFAYQLQAKTP